MVESRAWIEVKSVDRLKDTSKNPGGERDYEMCVPRISSTEHPRAM